MAADPDRIGDEAARAALELLEQWRREIIGMVLSQRDPISTVYRDLLREVDVLAETYRSRLNTTMGQHLQAVADAGDEAVLDALRQARVEVPLSYVGVSPTLVRNAAEYTADLVKGLTDYSRAAISRDIRLGALGGLPTTEVINRIGRNLTDRSTFSSIAARAEAIARTEVSRLYNVAYSEQATEVAQRYPERTMKRWVHSASSPGFTSFQRKSSRPDHMAMARRDPIPFSEPFVFAGGVEAQHPHDPQLPARHVVHCRCRLALVMTEE